MTREEAKELKDKIYNVDFDYEGDELIDKIYDDFENEEKTKWHNVSEADFPVKVGEYVTVCKNKNMEDGICLYEVSYWTGSEWDNRKHYEDIIAWNELPNYEEE